MGELGWGDLRPAAGNRASHDAATLPGRCSATPTWRRRLPREGIQEIKAACYAIIELLDDVLAALDCTGQRDDTLILSMSDHGEMLGDHGLLLKGSRLYDGLVKVLLLFS